MIELQRKIEMCDSTPADSMDNADAFSNNDFNGSNCESNDSSLIHNDVDYFANSSKLAISDRGRQDTESSNYRVAAFNPSMSLLELAYRLKQAELRVFGEAAEADEGNISVLVANGYSTASTNNSLHLRLGTVFAQNGNGFDFQSSQKPSYGVVHQKTNLKNVSQPLSDFETSNQEADMKPEVLRQTKIEPEDADDSDDDSQSMDLRSVDEKCKLQPAELGPTISTDRKHQCLFCSYSTNSRSHLRRHEVSIHYNGSKGRQRAAQGGRGVPYSYEVPRRHKCEFCEYQTDSMSHLRRHLGSIHDKEKQYRCQFCDVDFNRSEKVKAHYAEHHPDVMFQIKDVRTTPQKVPASPRAKPAKPVVAPKNGSSTPVKVNENETQYDRDLAKLVNAAVAAKGSGSKPFSCQQCNYAARDVWHLRRHIGDVHLKRRNYKCKVCNYATGRQDRLIAHMKGHGEIFCFYCDYSSAQMELYKQHVQTCASVHGGAAPSNSWYESITIAGDSPGGICEQERTCRLCNLVFATLVDHRAHIDVVHVCGGTAGDLICKACGFVVPQCEEQHELLYSHVIGHTVESFTCSAPNCSFKCTYSSTLEMHYQYSHNSKTGDKEEVTEKNVTTAAASDVGIVKQEIASDTMLSQQPEMTCESAVSATEKTPIKREDMMDKRSFSASTPSSSAGDQSATLDMTQSPLFSCPYCADRPPFKYRRSFEKHMRQHSSSLDLHVCQICNDVFASVHDLQTHLTYTHNAY